ncbi:MAG: flavin reductase family protein [Candidatus Lokiarchaeota archaeon]|nr:flavin reductase family protein [Candidatus Lokiarchaeota archaeon]MBD3202595.1 flavin reductase family protein [Candidatus Lokiarchaeota archaeon]
MKKQINTNITPISAPAVVISVGEGEKANLITLAWVGRVVSNPPVMSISIRPSRHSYSLIEELSEFVINIPFSEQMREMDYCGTRTGKKTNKWEDLNLTKHDSTKVKVPMVKEFPINIECKVINRIEHGTHVIYFGEVLAVNVDEELLKKNRLDPEMQDQIAYVNGKYYSLNKNPLNTHGFSNKE